MSDIFFLKGFDRFASHFSKGDMIFCEYEPAHSFYFIKTGRVQLTKVLKNVEKNIDVLQPGEIFGEMAILDNRPRSANAFAIDDLTLLEFDRTNFDTLVSTNPALIIKLLRIFTKRIHNQQRRLKILMIDDQYIKVAEVFLMLAEIESAQRIGDSRCAVKTTASDIANWSALSVAEVEKVLAKLSRQNTIEVKLNSIVINNTADLKRVVKNYHMQRTNRY